MIGRLVRSADFERVLQTGARARSPHFAIHHLDGVPSRAGAARAEAGGEKLSTGGGQPGCQAVDDSRTTGPRLWLGLVIPKRHARRAVTRSLLKRCMRAAVAAHAAVLPAGLWVIRVRAPFAPASFPSAASDALRGAAAGELAALMRDLGAATPA